MARRECRDACNPARQRAVRPDRPGPRVSRARAKELRAAFTERERPSRFRCARLAKRAPQRRTNAGDEAQGNGR